MSAGTLANGHCYPTQDSATRAFCSNVVGVSSGGTVTCSSTTFGSSTDGGGYAFAWTQRTLPTSGTVVTNSTVTVMFSCEYGLDPFELSQGDGALVAAAVVGVWCAGWAVRAWRRPLADPGERE